MVETPSATAAALSTPDPTVLRADADPEEALSWFESRQYGVAPVRTSEGEVAGYVAASDLAAIDAAEGEPFADELRAHTDPLDDATVLAPDTRFGDVLDALARDPFCFVDETGAPNGVPDAVLTRTDLNRPAAFVHLYAVLFAFETRLRALVAESGVDWEERLYPEQIETIDERAAAHRSDAHSRLHYTSLAMLAQITQRSEVRETLGFDSESEAKERLTALVALRNDVCHSRDLVHARETAPFAGRDAVALADEYELLDRLVDRLADHTKEGTAGVPRAEGESPPPVWDGGN